MDNFKRSRVDEKTPTPPINNLISVGRFLSICIAVK